MSTPNAGAAPIIEPGAGAGAPPATPPAGDGLPPPAAPGDWTTGLADDVRGYVQNKGWRSPGDVLESYRGLEKHLGVPKEQLVQLPTKDDDAEGWGKVYQRLGRPEKAEDYKLPLPKESDEGFVKWAKSSFHDSGLTAKQAEKLAAKWNEYAAGASESQREVEINRGKEAETVLRKEWGAAYDQNFKIVERAANNLGLSNDQLTSLRKAMGPVETAKFVFNLGTKIGEDSYHSGGGGGSDFGILTPEQAVSRIGDLRADPEFCKRYLSGDADAKAEMTKLNKWAYGE